MTIMTVRCGNISQKKERKKWVIILFVCIILVSALGSCLVPKPHKERPKTVLCLNGGNGIDLKITEENEFVLDDCREYLVDYSKEKQTFLYLNQKGAIVEQNMKTGEKNVITFECQTAHCGRRKPHFDFGTSVSPTAQLRG